MSDTNALYTNGKRAYAYAKEEALSELRRAEIDGDLAAQNDAVLKYNRLDVEDQNLDRIYANVGRQQQAAPQKLTTPVTFKGQRGAEHTMHLTDEEIEISHSMTGNPKISLEMREKLYAEKKKLYHDKLADGSYDRQTGFGKMP